MATVKVPRRVPVELMRTKLGDAKTEKILLAMFGDRLVPVAPLRLRRQTVEETLALMKDEQPNGDDHSANWKLVPTLFRAYFGQRGQARRNFIVWLNEQLAALDAKTELTPQSNGNGSPARRADTRSKVKAGRRRKR